MTPLAWNALLAGIGALGACATPAPQSLPTYDFGPQSPLCDKPRAHWVASCQSSFLPPLADPDAVRSYRIVIMPTGYILEGAYSLRLDVHADGSGSIYWSPKRTAPSPRSPPKGGFPVKTIARLRAPAPLTSAEVTTFERSFFAGGYDGMPRFAPSNCLDGHEHVLEWSASGDYHAVVRDSCQSDLPWNLFHDLAVAKGVADPPAK